MTNNTERNQAERYRPRQAFKVVYTNHGSTQQQTTTVWTVSALAAGQAVGAGSTGAYGFAPVIVSITPLSTRQVTIPDQHRRRIEQANARMPKAIRDMLNP